MKYQTNETNEITGIFYDQDRDIILPEDITIGLDRFVNGQLVRASDAEINTALTKKKHTLEAQRKIDKLKSWFNCFYDMQVRQAERAKRTNAAWSANDGEKQYYNLEELDAEANAKQSNIRELAIKLKLY